MTKRRTILRRGAGVLAGAFMMGTIPGLAGPTSSRQVSGGQRSDWDNRPDDAGGLQQDRAVDLGVEDDTGPDDSDDNSEDEVEAAEEEPDEAEPPLREGMGDTFGYFFGSATRTAPVAQLTNVCFHSLDFEIRDNGGLRINDRAPMADLAKRAHAAGTTPHMEVGGWGVDFSAATSNPDRFATDVADIMEEHRYEGFSLDWEYPEDESTFARLIHALRDEFDSRGSYYLGAPVSVVPSIAENTYAVVEVAPVVDYLFLMCYDFTGPWSNETGYNSPLSSTPTQSLSVASGIEYWRNKPIDDDKLIAGIPFYARSYSGVPDVNDGYHQPFEEGSAHWYDEVQSMLDDPSFEEHFDEDARVPFAYSATDSTFLSFENPESVSAKAEFIRDRVGGVGVWAINQDDNDELVSALH